MAGAVSAAGAGDVPPVHDQRANLRIQEITLTTDDFIALLPLLILTATVVVVMLAVAIHRRHVVTAILSYTGLGVAFASLWTAQAVTPRQVTPLLTVDGYALFYMGLILAASMAFVLLAYGYFENSGGHRDELYILMLVATLGSLVLVASSHLVSLFLGLELLSVSLYGMISYLHTRPLPLEAGLKYLVLAAASAAFLLFGMALVYFVTGAMDFAGIAAGLPAAGTDEHWLLWPGMALIVTGFGFKLALVPFHLWTPDVYEGAPAPVTAFVATVSKGAMFAALLRFFYASGAHAYGPVFVVFDVIAIASMFAGNILALMQTNVKRILAYSSIAHLGYLLVAFQAAGVLGAQAVTFYLVAYFVTIMGAFGVVTVLSHDGHEADSLEDYRGLFWRRPALGAIFTGMLLSLAGIPLTAGFIGKFYVVAAGASSALWALIVILAVSSAIGLYYYLRVLVVMYDRPAEAVAQPALVPAGGVALGVLAVLLVWLGVFPGPLLAAIRQVAAGLG
ncbi:MAG TPA: NADH-quinone oxidoreductase subunit N [Bryobacteraceae bacterium]|nr:NADH-quinone oxidoreductase subunit N [Bryobacteraceae bacterium]